MKRSESSAGNWTPVGKGTSAGSWTPVREEFEEEEEEDEGEEEIVEVSEEECTLKLKENSGVIEDTLKKIKQIAGRSKVLREEMRNSFKLKIRVYCAIEDLRTFCLLLFSNLETSFYVQILIEYYSKLYEGNPPGDLRLRKIVTFENGDKCFYFDRTYDNLKFQEHFPIYKEPPVWERGISALPNTLDEIVKLVPRTITLNRLVLIVTDPDFNDVQREIIWTNYRKFFAPHVFLEKLIERYSMPVLGDLTSYRNYSSFDHQYFSAGLRSKVKPYCVNMILRFIKDYYIVVFDRKMCEMIEKFCEDVLSEEEKRSSVADALREEMKKLEQKKKKIEMEKRKKKLLASKKKGSKKKRKSKKK